MDANYLRVELLGGLRAGLPGHVLIDLPCQQAGALPAYLALQGGRPVPREHLADLFWPDLDAEVGRRSLRQVLYSLRALLKSLPGSPEDILLAGRTAIRLDPARLSTDAREFEERLAQATPERFPVERARLLSEADALYRGDLLPGFYHEPFSAPRARLAEAHLSGLLHLAQALEESGEPDRAVETAKRALAVDPLLEEAHCHLMRLYAAKGQLSAVNRQYQALERALREELNAVPSNAASSLLESLRRSPPAVPSTPPSAGAPAAAAPSSAVEALPAGRPEPPAAAPPPAVEPVYSEPPPHGSARSRGGPGPAARPLGNPPLGDGCRPGGGAARGALGPRILDSPPPRGECGRRRGCPYLTAVVDPPVHPETGRPRQ